MSIKVRIYGGFLVVLLLTLGVGAVGWLSIAKFAQRVETADAAQNLLNKTGDLALAANRALLAGRERPGEEIGPELRGARAAIKSVAGRDADNPEVASAATSITESVNAFEKLLADYGSEQELKVKLQVTHRDLVEHLQSTVASIASAQRELLKKTNEGFAATTKDQIAANTQGAIAGHLMRVGYELRALEAKAEAAGAAADVSPLEQRIKMLEMLIKKEASNPDVQEEVALIKQSLANYREALTNVGKKEAQPSILPPLSEKLVADLGRIGNQLIKFQSDIELRLGEARDHIETGAELLDSSNNAIIAVKSVQTEEIKLLHGDAAAAQSMDAAAKQLFEITQAINYKVSENSTLQMIQGLLDEIKNYRASIPAIVEANAKQARLFDDIGASLASVSNEAGKIAASQREEMQKERDHATLWIAVGMVAAAAFGLVLSTLIGRGITIPIGRLVSTMAELARNKIDVEVAGIDRGDEIGEMARAVIVFRDAAVAKAKLERETAEQRRVTEQERQANAEAAAHAAQEQERVVGALAAGLDHLASGDMTFRIAEIFPQSYQKLKDDFNAAMSELQETMRVITANVHEFHSGSNEISNSANDLSRRMEQQAASLEETAATLDEITATVGKTAESAHAATQVVASAKSDAELSNDVVRQAVQSMNEIEQSAREISQIIGVIDEIAFQTNLLALNAGVEAARAGDAGRGFAVVASEVRSLAQRSADAAREIKALIAKSTNKVDQGVGLVNEMGKALDRIASQVSGINSLVQQIATAAREQSTGLKEVNTAINEMDRLTQTVVAMVGESTAASHALRDEADQVATLIRRFEVGANVIEIPQKETRKARPQTPAAVVQLAKRAEPAQIVSEGAALRKVERKQREDDWEEF